MKNLYTTLFIFLFSLISFAQAPEIMSYQAIVRNASDDLIRNASVGIRISILQNSDTGTEVYTETHTTTTNDNGLVTLEIGSGTTSNDFSSIDWGNGTYYIKSETDPTGGANYTIAGTSQLLSVPYALYAKSTEVVAADENGVSDINVPAKNIISNRYILINDDNNNIVYAYSPVTGVWSSQATTGFINASDITEFEGSFLVNDDNNNIVYAYSSSTETWSSQSTTGFINSDDVYGSNGTFLINDDNNNVVYAYTSSSSNWDAQSTTGFINASDIFSSDGTFLINDDNNNNIVYAYSPLTGTWASQSTTGFINSDDIFTSQN
ncbi:hypothetical protein [Winogradskyella sp. PG-2]|uniref:hypothetical protein n=1 Tax=Winogradskyella sp. PG-2 TaxID=754409 RepID=UPI0004587011|nr:hypothetical protein [Winogradskyella sp. PG-2]BAO75433.1 hypothetical protein WPG_1203 [Winogradskyella sp. PG-2]